MQTVRNADAGIGNGCAHKSESTVDQVEDHPFATPLMVPGDMIARVLLIRSGWDQDRLFEF